VRCCQWHRTWQGALDMAYQSQSHKRKRHRCFLWCIPP
jgi:hypothetical protein